MESVFNPDNPFSTFINKVSDLIVINILTLLCCLPVFSIGAALTAMYSSLYKLHKAEDIPIVRHFFRTFKENFKIATLLWLLDLLLLAVLGIDFYLIYATDILTVYLLKVLVYIVTILFFTIIIWEFVLLSRYRDGVGKILINSLCVGLANIGKTILMVLSMLVPVVCFFLSRITIPLVLALGIAMGGYLQTMVFSKVFHALENGKNECI